DVLEDRALRRLEPSTRARALRLPVEPARLCLGTIARAHEHQARQCARGGSSRAEELPGSFVEPLLAVLDCNAKPNAPDRAKQHDGHEEDAQRPRQVAPADRAPSPTT